MSIMKRLDLRFLSICKAIRIISARSSNIFIPLNKGGCDLIVDAKGVISRIVVLRSEKGDSVALRKGSKKELFSSSSCDFIFVDAPQGCYLIPSVKLNQTTALALSIFENYRIKENV